MTSDSEILHDLRRLKKELREKFGVTSIGVFDCYRHVHHDLTCEVNVLIELEKPLGWKYFALKEFLERKLALRIDIFTRKALKPALQEEILSKTVFA